ncbi:hypothetical protein ABW19_dt0208284 [Dactylella cylindrospora]|nr:hypothetical protein ABW19_dt0208284 [Dactylella cylindrospora]
MSSNPDGVPFQKSFQLCDDLQSGASGNPVLDSGSTATLPGQPSLLLDGVDSLIEFLRAELQTKDLDAIAPRLYPFSKHDSTLIDPLHRQVQKGRKIVLTENPDLHLVWFYDTVYIKPIPEYLVNHAFWEHVLGSLGKNNQLASLRPVACGFLRSYAWLIAHPSDYRIAVEHGLLPFCSDGERPSWQKFSKFISCFRKILDEEVSPRYTYGQLRLTRLNWAMRLVPPKGERRFYYHRVYWQTSDYVKHHFNTLLFIFAAVALLLGAMQVALAAREFSDVSSNWYRFAQASWIFSIATILAILATFLAIIIGTLVSLISQLAFGINWERGRRRLKPKEKV